MPVVPTDDISPRDEGIRRSRLYDKTIGNKGIEHSGRQFDKRCGELRRIATAYIPVTHVSTKRSRKNETPPNPRIRAGL
jgi:hypothetical protein